ncbi:TPA: P-type conjugative transfer protein VirB9 [Legionella pneumophila]|nr:P-type conjugative transfer protein VirB9 [Legionella pneumophila]HDS3863219.1 P-type conjugative transfer protein VirB9 [Legionella pneumophila]
MTRILMFFVLTATFSAMAHSQANPIPHPKDARIKMINFQENNVVPIYGKTFTTTQIVFGDDESVLGVEGGDTAGWIVSMKPNLANMIFIKPTVLDSNSNMTVVTNKHQYYFKVKSNASMESNDNEKVTYALKFIYPEDARKKLNERLKQQAMKKASALSSNQDPKNYNWNYRFSGNKEIMPLHVFDDGTFTYFELRKNQAVPAIFAVEDARAKESLVNIRREGNYMVVQRIAPQFTLRFGSTVASVFNSNEILRIRQQSRGQA